MHCKPVVDFFIGSLAPGGFRGWFAQVAGAEGLRPYLIKAGPGCGKSTLMRRLGEADAARSAPRGKELVERLHCSSDVSSLDGVALWDVGAVVLDATAPHALDCVYPGAAERVVSLYHAFDDDALATNRNAILAYGRQNTAALQQAAASFAFACGLLTARRELAVKALQVERLQAFAERFARRNLPGCCAGKRGVCRHRLLSAPTPDGLTCFYDTIPQLASDRLYVLQDNYGCAASRFIEIFCERALQHGYSVYCCHCPTDQNRVEHLFIPVLGLGFVTSNRWHPMRFTEQRNLLLNRFYYKESLRQERSTLNFQQRTAAALLKGTTAYQKKAKAAHDKLEQYYVAAADFAEVDALTETLKKKILY